MFSSKVSKARSVAAQRDLLGPRYAGLLGQLHSEVGVGEVGQAVPSDDSIALLNALPVAIYMTDNEGRILFYNEPARKLWGRDPDTEVDRWCGAWRLYTKEGVP